MNTTRRQNIAASLVHVAVLPQHRLCRHTAAALMAATLLLATSCQQADTDAQQPAPQQPVALQLTSGITTAVTRAYDATWESGDEIGVFSVTAGATTASDITYSGTQQDANILYTLESTTDVATAGTTYTGFSSTTPIYLPIDGSNIDVYAYYPHTTATTPATLSAPGVTISSDLQTLTVNLETTQTAEGQKGYDLLAAKATKASDNGNINIDHTTVPLLFQHCLSKVLIVVKTGTGYSSADLDETAVKLTGLPTTATFLPLTQALSVTSGSNDIVPYKLVSGDPDYSKLGDGKFIYRALVMPNQVASDSALTVSGNAAASSTRTIALTIGSGSATASYTYTIDNTSYPFVAGEEIKFTLTLEATGITVTAAITPWLESTTTTETPLYEDE